MIAETVTEGVKVSVESQFIEEQSDPDRSHYLFAYHITILNLGDQPIKLINRHWIITNADGEVREVSGEGVVGEQPYLHPGESFAYSSFCPLNTPIGTMHGSYDMLLNDGTALSVEIPVFSLAQNETLYH